MIVVCEFDESENGFSRKTFEDEDEFIAYGIDLENEYEVIQVSEENGDEWRSAILMVNMYRILAARGVIVLHDTVVDICFHFTMREDELPEETYNRFVQKLDSIRGEVKDDVLTYGDRIENGIKIDLTYTPAQLN